jgi:hypothetical protein
MVLVFVSVQKVYHLLNFIVGFIAVIVLFLSPLYLEYIFYI